MKIIFVCNNLHVGGIQKSLVNLLNEISDKHEITLFLFYNRGELKKSLPQNIKIISGNKFTRIMGMSHAEAKEQGIFTFAWRSLFAVLTKIFGIKLIFSFLSNCQKISGKYDISVSFMQNSDYKYFYGGCNEFVINSVKSERKISFVHCDFKNYFGNNEYNRSYYSKFDKIACVSESCKKIFDEVCPQHKNKTVTVHNCYNFKEMDLLSKEYKADYKEGFINLFSASRISEEKGIFRMFPILERFKQNGLKFIWRIAGDGPLMNEARKECEKHNISDCVEFLNMLDNPYPYFEASDLLIVPSYNEAAPMVYGEAAYFKTPIFTTNTTSASELVENMGIGFVCNNDDKAIENDLGFLLRNPQKIKEKAKAINISNENALKEFENLIK